MKKWIALLLCVIMAVSCCAACGTNNAAETTAPAEDTQTQTPDTGDAAAAEPVEIKIWHDGDEAIMQTIADKTGLQTPAETVVLSLPVDSIEGLR